MNKILQIPAVAGAIILTGALVSCANPGTKPDKAPASSTTVKVAPIKPRQLAEPPKKKIPAQAARPEDVEAGPWTGSFSRNDEIQTFRVVVDEVWRHCIVNAKGGMACFDSSDAP